MSSSVQSLLTPSGQERLPAGLHFNQTDNISYVSYLSPNLIDLAETFASNTGQFNKYTEGTPGTTSISGNAYIITHSSGALNDVISDTTANLTIPQAWIEANVNVTTTSATGYDNGGVGLVKDNNNFLFASVDRLGSTIRVQIKIGGTNHFLSSISQAIPTAFRLAMSLVGNSVCVFLDTGSGYVFKVSYNVATYYNFMTAGNLTGWYPGFTLANGGGASVWKYSKLNMGRFGGIGMRDQTIVTNEDGTPHFATPTTIQFSASSSDATGTSFCGIYTFDLVARTITQNSVIFVNRSSTNYNDLSAHVIWYSNGNRRLLISTWGNGFSGVIQVLHVLLTTGDVLTGTNLVSGMTQLSLPQPGGSSGAYDCMLVYDSANTRWMIGYVIVTNTNFVGSPFYAALAYSPDLSTWTAIGSDSSNMGYEGAKLLWNNTAYWLLVGGPAGSGNSSRVYDATLTYKGSLGIVFSGSSNTQPHPMMFPYNNMQYVLSFDNTEFNSINFTWGHIRVYQAPRF